MAPSDRQSAPPADVMADVALRVRHEAPRALPERATHLDELVALDLLRRPTLDDDVLVPAHDQLPIPPRVLREIPARLGSSPPPARPRPRFDTSLPPLPPGELRVRSPLFVFSAGSVNGGRFAALGRQPTTTGRSTSPPMNVTSTSIPTRGTIWKPYPEPAHGVATRSQHELWSFRLPSRSQWNCTFTRPSASVWISCPAGPTTIAVSVTCLRRLASPGRATGRSGAVAWATVIRLA